MAEALTNFSGLSSGMDYRALVDQIMTTERRPADRLQTQIDTDKKRLDSLTKFETIVTALKTATEGLRTGAAFDAYSVTAEGTDTGGRSLLTAVATAGATPGNYTVKVTSLASAQRTTAAASGQTSATTALGYSGSFNLKRPGADGAAIGTIAVDPADTLTAIRDKINALNTGTTPSRIQATIIAGGTNGNDQRLVLSSTSAGEANGFELVAASGTALTQLGLDTATTVDAKDAVLDVNGVEVRRTTNSVSDAIPNVTINLTSADANRTASITVERLSDGATGAAKSFVDAYNALLDFATKEGAATSTGPLKGDVLLRGIRGTLSSTLLASATSGATDMRTLSSVGISVDKSGKLTLDSAKFTTAAKDRIDDLKALFADRGAAFGTLASSYTESSTGQIAQRRAAIDTRTVSRTARIADIDARLDARKAALLAQYAKFEASLGKLKAIGDQMTAQFNGLTANND